MFGRDKDVKVSTSMHIDPIYWDSKIPGYLNWCVKKGYSDDVSFRQVQTHGHVYADAYYLTVEERNQVYQCQYGRSYHASLVMDMFVFQCLVGCRMGDLFNLTRSTIDDEMKLVNYANDIANKHTVIIAPAGVSTTSNATIVASFKAQARMRPSLKNFVGHISLSFHPDDTPRLTSEFMTEVAQ